MLLKDELTKKIEHFFKTENKHTKKILHDNSTMRFKQKKLYYTYLFETESSNTTIKLLIGLCVSKKKDSQTISSFISNQKLLAQRKKMIYSFFSKNAFFSFPAAKWNHFFTKKKCNFQTKEIVLQDSPIIIKKHQEKKTFVLLGRNCEKKLKVLLIDSQREMKIILLLTD